MNVFEDLVVELKEANLLEDTIMDSFAEEAGSTDFGDVTFGEEPTFLNGNREQPVVVGEFSTEDPDEILDEDPQNAAVESKTLKRREEEVSALQMVEHILSAVEREYLKTIANAFDELPVKKALHNLVRLAEDPGSTVYRQAEVSLSNEVDVWRTALARRDAKISVASLRRYCESCSPALSPQALLGMARFYRDLPHSETVRGKFDFVLTKTFSRPQRGGLRVLICPKSEMLGHLKTRFADWSDTVVSREADNPDVLLTVLSFTDFITEAQNAESFEELKASDFFKRIQEFKESVQKLFFHPSVSSAAVECNVAVGNRFVELVRRANEDVDSNEIREIFRKVSDDVVEEAAGRTFDVDISLEEENEESESDHEAELEAPDAPIEKITPKVRANETSFLSAFLNLDIFAVNKWLLGLTIAVLMLSVGLYIWADKFAGDPAVESTSVKSIDLEKSPMNEFIKTAKVSGDTFYAVAQPEWDTYGTDKQNEVLRKVYQYGLQMGCKKLNLLNSKGQAVGYGSSTRVELITP